MSGKRIVRIAKKILNDGMIIPQKHYAMFTELHRIFWAERVAYLRATEKERARMELCSWEGFLSSLIRVIEPGSRGNRKAASGSSQCLLRGSRQSAGHALSRRPPRSKPTASSSTIQRMALN